MVLQVSELAGGDEEELVGLVVVVAHELALDLDHLDVVVVQGGDDLRAPVVVEASELCCKVHLVRQPGSS